MHNMHALLETGIKLKDEEIGILDPVRMANLGREQRDLL